MNRNQLNLTVALKDDVITSIEDVESGLGCGCVCPACGERLIAKKGSKVQHHFAHYTGKNCEYGYESSLHLAAKEILSNAKKIMLPPVYVKFHNSYKTDELVSEAKEIAIDKVELEKRFNDVVPDIVVYSGGKQLFIEIYVTHPIDEQKLEKLKVAGISTIEIDLSEKSLSISDNELSEILLGDSAEKKWKYNALANRYLYLFYCNADKKRIVSRKYALRVNNCPVRSRIGHGKLYADLYDECLHCNYCLLYDSDNSEILCSGRSLISKIADFSIPEEKRISNRNEQIKKLIDNLFSSGLCPHCGGKIVERKSKYGVFWGCDNFPYCRFKISVDNITGELYSNNKV